MQNNAQQNNIFDSIKNTASNMWQNIKDGATIAADTIRYTPESLGELAADTKLFQEKMIRHMADRDKWTQEQFSLIPKKFWKSY